MSNFSVERVDIDTPGGISRDGLIELHGMPGNEHTVFQASAGEFPCVDVRTFDTKTYTFTKVGEPFRPTTPDNSQNADNTYELQPHGAFLDFTAARLPDDERRGRILQACASEVLRLSRPGEYIYREDNPDTTIASHGDPRVYDTTPEEAFWNARISEAPTDAIKRSIPNTDFTVTAPGRRFPHVRLNVSVEYGDTIITLPDPPYMTDPTTNEVVHDPTGIQTMTLKALDPTDILIGDESIDVSAEFARTAAALVFRVSDIISQT